MSFQLPTKEEKAQYVHSQFERIAKRYDLTNDAISMGMHRLWKAKAVTQLINDKSGHYLDVCSGTGDLALEIGSRLTTQGTVTALDFSEGMLQVARERLSRANLPARVQWKQGDAQNLPFSDATFDGAIISFGLRNLTDLSKGLSEMRRVVRPGGKVINLDLGRSTVPGFAQVFKLYFRHLVPIIGALLQNDRQAYTYLPESLSTYPSPDRLTEMFEEVGLVDVRYHGLSLGSVAMHVGTVP